MTATLYPAPCEAPNYALRRMLAVVLLAFALVVAAFAVMTAVEAVVDLGSRPAAASEIDTVDSGASPTQLHVAQSGDSLWAIADLHRGDIGRAVYVDALIGLNGGTAIQVGQAVRLP